MHNAPRRSALLNRALTSLSAIIAVSAIFGAKALEVEKREMAASAAVERLASTHP